MNLTSHGIIFTDKDRINKKSAIIFNNKYILVPATLLSTIIDQYDEFQEQDIKLNLNDALRTNQLIDVYNDIDFEILQLIKFQIIHELPPSTIINKKNVSIINTNKQLYKSSANLLYIFNCKNISKSITDLLNGFISPSQTDNNNGLEINQNKKINEEFYKQLLSSFLLLKFNDDSADVNRRPTHSVVTDDVVKKLSGNLINEEETHNLVLSIKEKENVMRPKSISKLENVVSITTPFGNECFFKTINIGKITNVFGINNCLMTVSMPLVWGSEGGAIYNFQKELIGIVINTTFKWKTELANITLVGNFTDIFAEYLNAIKQTNVVMKNEMLNYSIVPNNKSENYVVLIQMPSLSWGTGCFVKIRNKKFIITCSHVIENSKSKAITCYWKNGKFTSDVIYKHPHFNKPYDIAILTVPPAEVIPDNYFAMCDVNIPKVGQMVHTVGFPYFSNLATNEGVFAPSIFEGRITKSQKGLFFTDANVQAGQSGGPIFTGNSNLIGISVSNSKDELTQTIYPNINMSIPIYNIYKILDAYSKSGNVKDLQKLIVTDDEDIQRVWSLDIPTIISRL